MSMEKRTKEVKLEHELQDGSTKPEMVVVKRIKVRQINRAFEAVSAILDGFAANPELEQVVYDAFTGGAKFNPADYPDYSEEQLELIKKEYDDRGESNAAMAILKSSSFLLVKLPDQMAELVAAMSKIDKEILLDQDPEIFADVVVAILEVNEFNALWERAKMVFGETVAAFGLKTSKKTTEAKAGDQKALQVLN